MNDMIYQGNALHKRRSIRYMAGMTLLIIMAALMLYAIAATSDREPVPKIKPAHEWRIFGFK